eukprot:1160441-Pelagomonas_calceolata.AAC.3
MMNLLEQHIVEEAESRQKEANNNQANKNSSFGYANVTQLLIPDRTWKGFPVSQKKICCAHLGGKFPLPPCISFCKEGHLCSLLFTVERACVRTHTELCCHPLQTLTSLSTQSCMMQTILKPILSRVPPNPIQGSRAQYLHNTADNRQD